MTAVVIDASAGAEIVADTRRGRDHNLVEGPTFPRDIKVLRLAARG